MERINANEVQSMMEAYASVYKTEEQEVISEETQELEENRNQRGAAARANRQAAAAEEDRLYRAGGGDAKRQETRQMQGASRARVRRSGMTRAQVIELGRKNLAAKDSTPTPTSTSTSTSTGTAPTASTSMADKKPANPNVTKDGTKFERRLPTMAELRAAQQARKDAPKVLSRGEIEKRAVNAGVNAGKPAPKPATSAATAAATAAAKPAAAAPSPVVKKKPPMGARNRMRMEELDVFDTIKEYLIGEGATEEEALKQMLTLTDEQRTEILEGSCGSKMKKKKKGGY